MAVYYTEPGLPGSRKVLPRKSVNRFAGPPGNPYDAIAIETSIRYSSLPDASFMVMVYCKSLMTFINGVATCAAWGFINSSQ